MSFQPGVGATGEFDLRVSIATLARLLFHHPANGEWMLALERQATVHKTRNGDRVRVKSQPFGGAVRIHDLDRLQAAIGAFHFDSEHSRQEQDFRLMIRSSAWAAVREFAVEHLRREEDAILESDPQRELAEEIFDAMQVHLRPTQYLSAAVEIVLQNEPSPTGNPYANEFPTVRVYRIFEVWITDTALAQTMLKDSGSRSVRDLEETARQDMHRGGAGHANAILTLPIRRLREMYLEMSPEARNNSAFFDGHELDDTVAAILDDIPVPKYQRC